MGPSRTNQGFAPDTYIGKRSLEKFLKAHRADVHAENACLTGTSDGCFFTWCIHQVSCFYDVSGHLSPDTSVCTEKKSECCQNIFTPATDDAASQHTFPGMQSVHSRKPGLLRPSWLSPRVCILSRGSTSRHERKTGVGTRDL